MIQVTSAVLAEITQMVSTGPWLVLYDVHLNSTSVAYLVGNPEPITFPASGGRLYQPFPITFNGIEVDSEGTLPTMSVTVSNVTREIQVYLNNMDVVDRDVIVRFVHSDHLSSEDDAIVQRFTVTNATSSLNQVDLRLGLAPFHDIPFPRMRMVRNRCQHRYRGPVCGFAGTFPSTRGVDWCSKLLNGADGCRAHGVYEAENRLPVIHPGRFGGAPGLPRRN